MLCSLAFHVFLKYSLEMANDVHCRYVCFLLQGIPSGWQVRRRHIASHWSPSLLSRTDAHRSRGTITFRSSDPSSVKKYSTLGGISENDSRSIKRSSLSSFNVSDRVLGLIPSSSDIRSLNRSRPDTPSLLMIRRAHFFEMVVRIPPKAHTHRVSLSSHIVTSILYTEYL